MSNSVNFFELIGVAIIS